MIAPEGESRLSTYKATAAGVAGLASRAFSGTAWVGNEAFDFDGARQRRREAVLHPVKIYTRLHVP